MIDHFGYSFTLTIPPQKTIYYSGKRRKYGSLSQRQQWFFLNAHLQKIIRYEALHNIDWVFEEHEDQRLHIHGYIIPKDDKIYSVECFIYDFYTYNQVIGISISSYKKLSCYEKTTYARHYWDAYCQKHQDKIIFKSAYTHEIEHRAHLDNGVIRSLTLRPTNEALEDPNFFKTYRFGQNLFKVEF